METKTVSVKEWLNGAGRNACDPAKEWLTTLDDEATMLDAWNACERPDWMHWSARRSSLSDIDPVWKQLGFAICRKTEIGDGKVLWDIMPEAGKRCVETAERFVAGEATLEELQDAATAAEAVLAMAATAAWAKAAAVLATATRAGAGAAAAMAAAAKARAEEVEAMAAAAKARAKARARARVVWAEAQKSQCNIIRELIPNPWKA